MSVGEMDLVERYGAACRAVGAASVQFMQAKKAADDLFAEIKKLVNETIGREST